MTMIRLIVLSLRPHLNSVLFDLAWCCSITALRWRLMGWMHTWLVSNEVVRFSALHDERLV